MSRLIDADELKKNSDITNWDIPFGCSFDVIDKMPTIVDTISEKSSKETAEKILNTEFFVFEIENRSEEYQKGYMQAVRECRSRRDELTKQFGVEIKE